MTGRLDDSFKEEQITYTLDPIEKGYTDAVLTLEAQSRELHDDALVHYWNDKNEYHKENLLKRLAKLKDAIAYFEQENENQ